MPQQIIDIGSAPNDGTGDPMELQTDVNAAPVHGIVRLPFTPYYEANGITIYNADCRKVLPWLDWFDLLLTDPPYGIKRYNRPTTHGSRLHKLTKGKTGWNKAISDCVIKGLIDYAQTSIVWGANNFDLPKSEYFLVWNKLQTVPNFASAELAWTNAVCPAKVFTYSIQQHNANGRIHPAEKPLALMRWCLSLVPDAETVLDPFMGCGTTLVAAKLEGRKAVGIELDEQWCESAAKRLSQGVLF